MSLPSDIAPWVRSDELSLLPVATVAQRVARMAQYLTSMGDITLANPQTRPLGVDYAFIILADGFHARINPTGEPLLAEAYTTCKTLLKPLLTDTQTWNVPWDESFSPYVGAADWLTDCLEFWEGNRNDMYPSRLSQGCVEVKVFTDSEEDESSLTLQATAAVLSEDNTYQWVVSALKPSREQRRWFDSRAWQSQGNAMWCAFSHSRAAVASIVDAIDALAHPSDETLFTISVGGMVCEAVDTDDWRDLSSVEGSVILGHFDAEDMTLWPGSDAASIMKACAEEVDIEMIGHFDALNTLAEPISIVTTDEGLQDLRNLGFVVTDDGDGDDETLNATVYPRTTRSLVVR